MPVGEGLPELAERVQTARLDAVLLAANAWDLAPIEMPCPDFMYVTLYCVYERGAVGGAVDIQAEISPYSADAAGVEDWFPQTVLAVGAVVVDTVTQSRIQTGYDTYGEEGAGALPFPIGPILLAANVERLRINCRESVVDGIVGSPGDMHIVAFFSGV